MRVLVIEDEAALRDALKRDLVAAGFTVDVAADGEEGLYAGREYPIDVAIVDLGLPKVPGLDLIRTLRSERKTFPILVLTARDRWQDKVAGLDAGADDYVAKPFRFEEVLARVQALLRRAGGWASPVLSCGPVVLDLRSQTVTVESQAVDLTTFEYRLLEHLMMRAELALDDRDLLRRPAEQARAARDAGVVERGARRRTEPALEPRQHAHEVFLGGGAVAAHEADRLSGLHALADGDPVALAVDAHEIAHEVVAGVAAGDREGGMDVAGDAVEPARQRDGLGAGVALSSILGLVRKPRAARTSVLPSGTGVVWTGRF